MRLPCVVVRPLGSQIYVSTDNGLNLCSVDARMGIVTACSPTAVGYSFGTPYVISLNPAGTYLYVSSGAGTISKCTVAKDGSLSGCIADPNISNAGSGLAFSLAGNYLYYTSQFSASFITKCSVDPVTGDLSHCAATGGTHFSHILHDITLNPAGTFAYVQDFGSGILYYCAVNQLSGELTNCQDSATTATTTGCSLPYSFLDGLAINSTGTMIYLTSAAGQWYTASLLPSGQLGSCSITSSPSSVQYQDIALR